MNEERESNGDFVIYSSEDGKITIEVRIEDENVWLTQQLMAELFQTTQQNISLHILNILEEGELLREATHKEYLSVRREGNRDIRRRLDYYNLDMIIAVGYRVKSAIGTKFRTWATQRLSEFLVKGFIMDDARLKEGRNIGSDYFDELLERIRDIRASEKRFYQKIRDIYKLAVDYDSKAEETKLFFQIVQNKLHFAISGKAAAELIAERADATKPNMGFLHRIGNHRITDCQAVTSFRNRQTRNGKYSEIILFLHVGFEFHDVGKGQNGQPGKASFYTIYTSAPSGYRRSYPLRSLAASKDVCIS